MMKQKFLIIILLFTTSGVIGQTGPGGIGNSSTNMLWYDINSENIGNGAMVEEVTDFSGNNNHLVQTDVLKRPVNVTNVFNSSIASLRFDGGQSLTGGAMAAYNGVTKYNQYYIGSVDDLSLLSVPFAFKCVTPSRAFSTGFLTQFGLINAIGRRYGFVRRASLGSPTTLKVFQNDYNSLSGLMNAYLDFSLISSDPDVIENTFITHLETWLGGSTGASGTGYYMDGFISEVFAFNIDLNTAQTKILQNYIGAKYGTTIPTDHYDYEATHGVGLVGIGRDNNLNKHLNSIGNGMVRIQKSAMTDGQYLYVGHNDENYSSLSTDVPVLLLNSSRLLRTWRMDEPTDVGNIQVTFQLDSLSDFSPAPSAYKLIVDADGVFAAGATTYSGTYNAVTRTVHFTGIDMNAGDYFTLLGDEPVEIFSVSDGNWSDPSTWNCSCVPSGLNLVTISSFTTVNVDTDGYTKDLTIAGDGELEWTFDNNLTIQTDGLTIFGDITMPTGSITFAGTSIQEIDLNGGEFDFNDIEINNNGDVVELQNGTIVLNGTLTPTSGKFDFTAGSFIVNSVSAVSSARIAAVNVNAELSGNATVRRFIPAGVAGNRNLASPVVGATLAHWDDSLAISGYGFPDGCAYGDTTASGCYFSVKYYWQDRFYDITNINYVLENGKGYEIFIGDDLVTYSGTTIAVTGALNNSDVTTMNTTAWGTLGNPYASPVLFSQASTTNVMGKYFYIYDPASGGYQWYDKVSNTSSIPQLANGLLASGQGFWVKDFGFLTFPQSAKTSTNATFIRNSVAENGIQLKLTQDNTTYFNVSSIVFDHTGSDLKDEMDIEYLSTGLEKASSLYMTTDTFKLTKSYLLRDYADKTINVALKALTESYFTIHIADVASVNDYSNVYLFDQTLNKMIDLRAEGAYTFYSEVGEFDRFKVIFTNDVLSTDDFITTVNTGTEINITQLGSAIEISALNGFVNNTVYVTNALGQEILSPREVNLSNGSKLLNLSTDLKGLMIVVVKNVNGITTKKIIL
ncbi:hypothetical protein DNU06_00205 [Putridiphycobacter roseus]|uniref:DUF8202 domain-containing protein n=2 Tax=Putridiphycobacter roseus TaxID=2219161 RepID=A0A2W1NRP1_9FLAO|nr:hypothetical protein DNU06_00205 [Putridiphycobacter roseus]